MISEDGMLNVFLPGELIGWLRETLITFFIFLYFTLMRELHAFQRYMEIMLRQNCE